MTYDRKQRERQEIEAQESSHSARKPKQHHKPVTNFPCSMLKNVYLRMVQEMDI